MEGECKLTQWNDDGAHLVASEDQYTSVVVRGKETVS